MIVTCPACRSRYRCGDLSEPGATAHCSACDERFPLTAQRKSYRVQQAASTLSATMEVTAVQLSGAVPPVDEQGPGPDPLLEGRPPETRIDLQFGSSGQGSAADPPVSEPVASAPLAPPVPPEAPATAELFETTPEAVSEEIEGPAEDVEPRRSRMPQTVGELLVALVPASLGGVVAYYFAGLFQQSPILCAALGSLVGLLFGWACLLWITRDD